MRKRKNKLLLPFITSLFVLFPICSFTQEHQEINNELLNCEIGLAYQDIAVTNALEKTKEGGVLIVIVKLGDGENSRELIRRRLYNVRQYFKGRGGRLASEKVVIAEGEPIKGNGRIEFYLNGKLHQQLLFPKNSYICHSCCGPDETFYPDKADYDQQQKRKLKRKG